MRNILTTILLIFIVCLQSQGQSEATYSQYMFNGLAINPAYAGSHQSLSISALSRMQSIGVDGAPNTQTFTAHTGIKDQKIGLGFLVMNDKIGVTNQTGVYLSYAYKIKFENSTLSLGLQGGGSFVDANYSELLIYQPGDPNFTEDVREFRPNFGAGAYFHSKYFYAGISMPQILDIGDKRISQLRPFIVTSGVVLTLSPVLKLKPNILFRVVNQQAVEFNYNTNLLIHDILWIGFSYRPSNTANSILEIQLTDQLRIGYAYDVTINDFGRANTGTHEFMINYQLNFNKKGVINPRYF